MAVPLLISIPGPVSGLPCLPLASHDIFPPHQLITVGWTTRQRSITAVYRSIEPPIFPVFVCLCEKRNLRRGHLIHFGRFHRQ
jgi:hypothetical protein